MPFPTPGDLPDPGIEPASLASPALADRFFTQGADGGSNHELLIAKFRIKLKKVGKTTRPFRYDLNQIPYDYTGSYRSEK